MKKFVIISLLALTLGACAKNPDGSRQTFAQWSQGFQTNLGIVNQDIAAVDQTVKNINATLYSNCNTMVSITGSINTLASQCSKASPYTSVANSYILNFCQSQAIAQNGGVAASLDAIATGISSAKSTLATNKKACAS